MADGSGRPLQAAHPVPGTLVPQRTSSERARLYAAYVRTRIARERVHGESERPGKLRKPTNTTEEG